MNNDSTDTINYFCIAPLAGCASQTLEFPLSVNDPANPHAPESAFTPRPDWFITDVSAAGEKPTELPLPLRVPPTLYTCPMHPEVVQSSQDRCPDCCMKLIPGESQETAQDSHR